MLLAQVELVKDRLVEQLTLVEGHAQVKLLWLSEQYQGVFQQLRSNGELRPGVVHPSAQHLALSDDGAEPLPNFVNGHSAVCRQVDEILFLLVEARQLGL